MHDELWSFALDLYARPGIEPACLQLHAEGGNVCLLLCGAWLGARNVACVSERVVQLQALGAPWHAQVVQPLRELRQQWRAPAMEDAGLKQLREEIKALELAAERQLLERLYEQTRAWRPAGEPSIMAWLRALLPPAAAQDHPALQVLRAAALEVQASLPDAMPLSPL